MKWINDRSDSYAVGLMMANWIRIFVFTVITTGLSILMVQYGVDFQTRGYPLPFLHIGTGMGDTVYFSWEIPNLLLSLGVFLAVAIFSLTISRFRVAAKCWVWSGIGVALATVVACYCLWCSVKTPIEGIEAWNHAIHVSIAIRHLLAIGTLISAVCFFVFFLKVFPVQQQEKQYS
jgi:hypothetical protein